MFDTTQAILEKRGEDMALRRTNGSDRRLTGFLADHAASAEGVVCSRIRRRDVLGGVIHKRSAA